MNDILLSLLLGLVEGLTEFLPVSSTAHLRIVEALLHLDLHDAYWKMYTIVIQLGAILALPVYFWHRILKFLSTFPRGERGDRNVFTHPLGLTLIAFIVTAIGHMGLAALSLGDGAGRHRGLHRQLRPRTSGLTSRAGCHHSRVERMEDMTLPQAAWIGFAQIASAVFPGTSRSMSTIAAGEIAGLTRSGALEFSFFLSMPTMVVATGYDLLKTVLPHRHAASTENLAPLFMTSHNWVVLMIGFVISFIVALGVVAWFMNWVRARGFAPFAIYRIALAAALFWLLWRGVI